MRKNQYNNTKYHLLKIANTIDWFYHLNDLILNKNKRIEYGEKLYEWAKENYDIFKVNERRRKAFADLIKA